MTGGGLGGEMGGRLDGQRHLLPIRIYYEDTDFSGAVYHANYLRFLERGRTEFLRALGFDQRAMLAGADPVGFVVRRMTIDFLAPAAMDDLIVVETNPLSAAGAAIVLAQRILRDATVLVQADVKVAAVTHGRARRLPAGLAKELGRLAGR